MHRRPGLTLTEVLVTLAILSFGVLAILTLFPLAASQMAIAVREDRSAQAAAAADGYLRAYWKSEVVDKVKAGQPVTEPFYEALDDPNDSVPLANQKLVLPFGLGVESSNPVFVDPMGFVARSGGDRYWMGDSAGTGVPRRSLSKIGSQLQAFRTCSLMDGLGYDENGRPTPDRELRYNWLWVLQRPNNSEKLKANMTVLVFDRRAHMYAPAGAEGWFQTFNVTLAGSTTVTLSFNGGVAPDVPPGTWIAEVTQLSVTLPPAKVRNANFYQVVSSRPGAAPLTIDVELNLPLKVDAAIGVNLMKFLVLRGVSGVYPRPPLTDD